MADLAKYPPWNGDVTPWDKTLAPMQDELWRRFSKARQEFRDLTGVRITVASGVRDSEQQVFLYGCYQERLRTGKCPNRCCGGGCCNLAAVPGTSPHERKVAIDMTPNSDADSRIRPIFAKYGLIFPVHSPQWEPWHTELASTRGLPMPDLPDDTPLPKPRKVVQTMHLISNLDGRMEEFDIFAGGVVHRWQQANLMDWSTWVPLGGLPEEAHDIAVGRTKDGRLEVVAKNSATGHRWRRWQKVPSGSFDAWVAA